MAHGFEARSATDFPQTQFKTLSEVSSGPNGSEKMAVALIIRATASKCIIGVILKAALI